MVTPVSRQAYAAEYDLLDQALESERGVQRLFKGYEQGRGQAFNFRTRLHSARDYDRRENRRIYPEDDPMHGQTLYAQLTVRAPYWDKERKAWVLMIEKPSVAQMVVEEIPPPQHEVPTVVDAKQFEAIGDWFVFIKSCKAAGLSSQQAIQVARELEWPNAAEGIADWWNDPNPVELDTVA